MMTQCKIRKGFLTLRDCGNAAARNCETCARPACSRHLTPSSGFAICLECASQPAKGRKKDEPADEMSPEYPYRYRRRFYDGGYTPIYYGIYSSSYDDYDVRSFDSGMNTRADDHDDVGGSTFGDS